MDTTVGGQIRLGGANGLEASITASIFTGVPSAQGSITHTGGWTPFSGEIASTLVTPSFDGEIAVGVGGKLWSVKATTGWSGPLDLLPFGATRGFLKMTGDTDAKGPQLDLAFTQATAASSVEYKGYVCACYTLSLLSPTHPHKRTLHSSRHHSFRHHFSIVAQMHTTPAIAPPLSKPCPYARHHPPPPTAVYF